MSDVLPHSSTDLPDARCSSRRCTDAATWALLWNNHRLHSPERRKTWLACDSHREHLTSFLQLRGFLREVEVLVSDAERRGTALVG